jgi:hypothetical protein
VPWLYAFIIVAVIPTSTAAIRYFNLKNPTLHGIPPYPNSLTPAALVLVWHVASAYTSIINENFLSPSETTSLTSTSSSVHMNITKVGRTLFQP